MDPKHEVLWKAGWTKAGLRGQRIGSFMGDSGSEWNYIYLKQDRYQFPGVKLKKQQGLFCLKLYRWVCLLVWMIRDFLSAQVLYQKSISRTVPSHFWLKDSWGHCCSLSFSLKKSVLCRILYMCSGGDLQGPVPYRIRGGHLTWRV